MGYPIALIRQDKQGAGIIDAFQMVIEATGVDIEWQVLDTDTTDWYSQGKLPQDVFDAIQRAKTAVIVPMKPDDFRQLETEIWEKLELYVNLRPAKTMAGIPSNFQDIDLMIVRETTEGIYAGIEFERTSVEAADARSFLAKLSGRPIREDAALGIKPISVKGCGQIIEFAFNFARDNGRQKVTAVHQAKMMAHTDGLFLEIARDVAQEFPEIAFEDKAIEVVCRELIQHPTDFDVLVMPNLYGDLLAHLCAGLVGGTGVPNAYIGDKYAIFSAQSSLSGQTSIDPTPLILSGALLLQHLGEQGAAQRLKAAVEEVMAAKVDKTVDSASESDDSLAIAKAITQSLTA